MSDDRTAKNTEALPVHRVVLPSEYFKTTLEAHQFAKTISLELKGTVRVEKFDPGNGANKHGYRVVSYYVTGMEHPNA